MQASIYMDVWPYTCACVHECTFVCMHSCMHAPKPIYACMSIRALLYEYVAKYACMLTGPLHLSMQMCISACAFVYICVCTFACMYACLSVCLLLCMYVSIYACTYAPICIWMYACTYTCMEVHTHVCACMHIVFVYGITNAYTCEYIDIFKSVYVSWRYARLP